MKTLDYVDAIRTRYGVSDYKAAQLLEITRAAVSDYRNRGRTFDDTTALRVAELLEIDPAEVLADVHAERAKDPKVRKVWQRIADQLHGTAAGFMAAVILSALLLGINPGTAQAHSLNGGGSSLHSTGIMRSSWARLRRLFTPSPHPATLHA